MGEPSDDETAATIAESDPALAATVTPTLAPSGVARGAAGGISHEEPKRYRRGAEIGRGGMGRVVVAHDSHLGRDIAMKELLTGGAADGMSIGAVSRFLSEARVTGQLEHPSIVPVHELGRAADGSLYYTMKRIRGRSLASLLSDAQTLEARLHLLGAFRDVCQALAYAHSRGVVHRDLKPDNVMVGEFGETLVVDWGIAKVRGQDDPRASEIERRIETTSAAQTMDGSAIGTPAYMSPEQARGDLAAVDERSDVWGLGAILFEILTGRPPFVGRTALAVLAQVLTEPPPRVRALAPDAPAELAAIVERALRPERDQRYATAQELERDVSAWQDGRVVGAYSYSSWELLRRFARKNRAATIAATSVLAAALIASVLVYRSYLDAKAARAIAERRATEATSEREHAVASERAAQITLAEALLERAERAIEDGDPLGAAVFAAGSMVRDPVAAFDSGTTTLIVDDETSAARERSDRAFSLFLDAEAARGWTFERRLRLEAAGPPIISPSGRLAAGSHDSVVTIYDLETGTSREIVVNHPDELLAFTDEDHIAVRCERSGVYELATGRLAFETVAGVAASAVGNALVLVTREGLVARYDLARGVEIGRFQSRARGGLAGIRISPDAHTLATWDFASAFVEVRTLDASQPTSVVDSGGWTRSVCFSPDGLSIAVGVGAADVRFASLVPGVPSPPRIRTRGFAGDLAWPTAGQFFAIEEDMAGFHRLSDGRRTETLRSTGSITSYGLAAGDRVAIAPTESDRDTIVYRRLRTPPKHDTTLETLVASVVWDSARSRVVAIGLRAVYALELRNGVLGAPVLLGALPPDVGLALDGAVAPDGAIGLTTTIGAVILLEPGRPARAVIPPSEGGEPALAFAFDPSGRLLLAGGMNLDPPVVRRFDRDLGEEISPLSDGGTVVVGISFSADGRHMATAALDGVVRLWEYGPAPRLLRELSGHEGLASDAAFAPDGVEVATVDGHGSVRVFAVESGTLLRSARPHSDWINRIVWSDDGRFLSTASDDGTARLLSAETLMSLRIVRNTASTIRASLTDRSEYLVTNDQERIVFIDTASALERPDAASLLARAEEAAGMRLEGLTLVVR